MSNELDKLAAEMRKMKPSKSSRKGAMDAAMSAFSAEFSPEETPEEMPEKSAEKTTTSEKMRRPPKERRMPRVLQVRPHEQLVCRPLGGRPWPNLTH